MEYEKTESRWTIFLSNLSIGKIIVFVILLLIVFSVTNKKDIDPSYNKIIYGGLLAVIAYMYFKPSKDRKLLERWEAAGLAQRELNRMKRDGEFPFDSVVKVKPASKLREQDDLVTGQSGPVSWDIGFSEMVHGKKYIREGVISVHPYSGSITGVRFMPTGYTGNENPDVRVVPMGVVMGSVRTTDFSGNQQK